MSERVRNEIERLHVFLEAWLSGSMPFDESRFAKDFADRLSVDFFMIQPGGSRSTKEQTVDAIKAGYGKSADFRITIHNVHEVELPGSAGACAACYEEHQSGALNSATNNVRLSTVIFHLADDGTLLWRHLQETWASSGDV